MRRFLPMQMNSLNTTNEMKHTYQVETRIATERKCGWRKPGGFYLVTDPGEAYPCGRLPHPVIPCSCCGRIFEQTRNIEFTHTKALFSESKCAADAKHCSNCAFTRIIDSNEIGLMWVGKQFYSAQEFESESRNLGISKRIASNSWHRIEPGVTWIALAHPEAMPEETCTSCNGKPTKKGPICKKCDDAGKTPPSPGIFRVFRPSRIEYIVDPNDSPGTLETLHKAGVTLCKDMKPAPLFDNQF